jgi:hypothetical protein
MKHLRAGAVFGAGVLLGGVIWNLLGDAADITITFAIIVTLTVAAVDYITERRGT